MVRTLLIAIIIRSIADSFNFIDFIIFFLYNKLPIARLVMSQKGKLVLQIVIFTKGKQGSYEDSC